MDDKRDIIDEIENFKEQFPLNAEDTKKAEDLTRELYGGNAPTHEKEEKGEVLASSRKRNIVIWCVSVFLVCALFLGIFLPFFLRDNGSNLIYYDYEEIKTENVEDISVFMEENNLSCKYYRGTAFSNTYQAGYIAENSILAYLQQQSLVFAAEGFDTMELGIVFVEGKFREFDDFEDLTETIEIDGLSVQYLQEEQANGSCILYASFRLDSLVYYLQVTTQSAEGKLETYIGALA